MADPHGLLRAEMIQQLHHVRDYVLEGVVVVSGVRAGAAIAAHVGGYRPEAEAAEHR